MCLFFSVFLGQLLTQKKKTLQVKQQNPEKSQRLSLKPLFKQTKSGMH